GSAPLGLVRPAPGATEVALLAGGPLVSSQLLPARRVGDMAALERSVARQLAEEALAANDVPLYCWQLANGDGPGISLPGEGDLLALARGRLVAPEEFFSASAPAMLPAGGAGLGAGCAREQWQSTSCPRRNATRTTRASRSPPSFSLR